jgi:hypothetical protein
MSERRTIGKTLSDLLGFMVENLGITLSMWFGYSFAIAVLYRAGSDLTWTLDRAGYLAIIPTAITSAVWKPYKERQDELKATLRRQERELDELRRERDESEGG